MLRNMKLSNELTVKEGEIGSVSRSWALRAAFLVLLLVAAALRFHDIGRRSIWFDEAVTLAMVCLPFYEGRRAAWSKRW